MPRTIRGDCKGKPPCDFRTMHVVRECREICAKLWSGGVENYRNLGIEALKIKKITIWKGLGSFRGAFF